MSRKALISPLENKRKGGTYTRRSVDRIMKQKDWKGDGQRYVRQERDQITIKYLLFYVLVASLVFYSRKLQLFTEKSFLKMFYLSIGCLYYEVNNLLPII